MRYPLKVTKFHGIVVYCLCLFGKVDTIFLFDKNIESSGQPALDIWLTLLALKWMDRMNSIQPPIPNEEAQSQKYCS